MMLWNDHRLKPTVVDLVLPLLPFSSSSCWRSSCCPSSVLRIMAQGLETLSKASKSLPQHGWRNGHSCVSNCLVLLSGEMMSQASFPVLGPCVSPPIFQMPKGNKFKGESLFWFGVSETLDPAHLVPLSLGLGEAEPSWWKDSEYRSSPHVSRKQRT